MKKAMRFAPDLEDALKRYAEREDIWREEALALILQDRLIGGGPPRSDG